MEEPFRQGMSEVGSHLVLRSPEFRDSGATETQLPPPASLGDRGKPSAP